MWWKDIFQDLDYTNPSFFYSRTQMRKSAEALTQALTERWSVYYAMKANPNLNILRFMQQEKLIDGVDVASVGEWEKAILAGFEPSQISVTGPVKTASFLKTIIKAKVGCICVESMRELQCIEALGGLQGGRILLRVNPADESRSFQLKISGRAMPFGFDEEELEEVLSWLKAKKTRIIDGIHIHAGSQCFSARGYSHHLEQVLRIVDLFAALGIEFKLVNIGGGLGVGNWLPLQQINVQAVGNQLNYTLRRHGYQGEIRMEPGRYLVAAAGVYAVRVHSIKKSRGKIFVILEGGTNHLGMLKHRGYQNKQIWVENTRRREGDKVDVQLVGPLCTPLDMLGGLTTMVLPEIGDILLFINTGAYGLSMSPIHFLQHPPPKEYFLD